MSSSSKQIASFPHSGKSQHIHRPFSQPQGWVGLESCDAHALQIPSLGTGSFGSRYCHRVTSLIVQPPIHLSIHLSMEEEHAKDLYEPWAASADQITGSLEYRVLACGTCQFLWYKHSPNFKLLN